MIRPPLPIRAFCVMTLLLIFACATFADGVTLPDDPSHGCLSIEYHDVTVTIHDGIVITGVDQVFRNDTGHDVEGCYIFPLPEGAGEV